jgi:hypothetical protein
MSGRNWNRPLYRRRGREAGPIRGDDIPVALRSPPPAPRQSKAEVRTETEQLIADYLAKRPSPPDGK